MKRNFETAFRVPVEWQALLVDMQVQFLFCFLLLVLSHCFPFSSAHDGQILETPVLLSYILCL